MIAGLERPTAGQIIVAGHELDGPSPATSIVFQDHGHLQAELLSIWAVQPGRASLRGRGRPARGAGVGGRDRVKTLLANPNASQALTDRIVVAALWKSLCLASADPALITRWDSLFELPAPSP